MKNRSIVSFFWQHIKPYKWHYLVMLSAPLLSAFYPFAYNYAIKLFIDAMTKTQKLSYNDITFPIVLFLFTQFMLDFIWRVSNIAEWRSEPYVRRSILLQSYDYVQHHTYAFFQNNFTGAISSKLKGLLDGYDKFWAEMHHGLLAKVFKTVVNLIALAWVNTRLGLFVFVWCIVYVPIIYRLSQKLNKLSFAETESRHNLIGQVSDKITNIISLFSFAARQHELDKLDKEITHDFIPKQVKMYKYDFMLQVFGGSMYFILYTIILFYAIHLRMTDVVTIGDFAFIFGISIIVAEDIWHATTSLQDFSRSMGDLNSALSILQVPNAKQTQQSEKTLKIKSANIEMNKLQFSYDGGITVFDKLDLAIQSGEKIGLVGHSGAGKSSLVNLLLRYFSPAGGTIKIDGQNIADISEDSLRQAIAVIPQDTLLFHRSLIENIRFGKPSASDEEVIAASKKAYIHDFIMSLPKQYNTYVGERGVKLSGGQRQRIAIARAILKNAPILVLDEATSALDSQTEQLIQESLNFYIEDEKKTVIAIAHRLSTLKHMDRIIFLDNGRIIEEGTHEALLNSASGEYKKLWSLQSGYQ